LAHSEKSNCATVPYILPYYQRQSSQLKETHISDDKIFSILHINDLHQFIILIIDDTSCKTIAIRALFGIFLQDYYLKRQ